MNSISSTPSAESEVALSALGHYQLIGRLGEGGFGEVFEAWDPTLHRRVAIKRLRGLSSGPHSRGLIDEARLAASLQHSAFVKIYAIEEDGGNPSIVMELVPGKTLKELVQTEPLDEARALDIVLQVAEAMREAHDSGLIHGDLKPSNLILDPSGKVRILDFGLASKADPQATSSMIEADPQGTIAYMAPERLLGNPSSVRSDVYALGVILYELVGGARPFATLSGLALAAAHMQSSSAEWPYPATMPQNVITLIRAMTARAPDERTADMQEVCARISTVDKTGPVTTLRWLAWNRLKKKQRARLFAVIVVMLLTVGIWWAWPYWPVLQKSLTPFSASVAMKDGLDALKQFDRPDNLNLATHNFQAILERNRDNAAAAAGLSLTYSFRYFSDRQDETWLQKADASAQQALALNDQLALSHAAVAAVLEFQGKREPALQSFERALGFDPDNYFAQYGKVRILRGLKRYADAEKEAVAALLRLPQERVFADELGTIHFEQASYAKAEQAFRRSIEIQPDSGYAYANLAATLRRLNRADEALQVLQQGLQVNPNAKLYGNLGNALFQRGDYVAAAAAFEHAVSPTKGNPREYLNWANLADALLWIPGRQDQANAAYEKAKQLLQVRLERMPNDATLLSRMGLYTARVGDRKKAEELVARAALLAPKSPDVRFRAGLAYELVGNRDAALAEIAQAKELGYPAQFIVAEPALVALRRDARYPQD